MSSGTKKAMASTMKELKKTQHQDKETLTFPDTPGKITLMRKEVLSRMHAVGEFPGKDVDWAQRAITHAVCEAGVVVFTISGGVPRRPWILRSTWAPMHDRQEAVAATEQARARYKAPLMVMGCAKAEYPGSELYEAH